MCVCVCVCVCERERECVCVCERERECVCVCSARSGVQRLHVYTFLQSTGQVLPAMHDVIQQQ